MRLIDADALVQSIKDWYCAPERCNSYNDIMCRACQIDDALSEIDRAPTVDAKPVRHGRWIWNPDGMDWGLGAWCCSKCKAKAETWWANDPKYNPFLCSGGHFCGNCGARMDLKDGDEG